MPSLENIDQLILEQIAHWYSKGDVLNPDKLIGTGILFIRTFITLPGPYQLSGDAKILHNKFKIIFQYWDFNIEGMHFQQVVEACGDFNLENSDIYTYFHRNADFPDFPKVVGIWCWVGEVFECEKMMIGREPGEKEIYYNYVGEWHKVQNKETIT